MSAQGARIGGPIGILAVDGGNSKADLALVSGDGALRAFVHGPTISHQQVPMDACMDRLRALVAEASAQAGLDPGRRPTAEVAVLCLAGADYAADVRRLSRAIAPLGLGAEVVIRNDGFAGLRAGTRRPWGVAVIIGSGVNCVGMAPNGRTAAFPAVGAIAGDWGGGMSLGEAALAAAVRGRDGRGERTSLERLVPRHFGLTRPGALTYALYRGAIPEARLRELAPLVFEAAGDGDHAARAIVDRLADEIAGMAVAMLRRLRLVRADTDVVLAGAIMRANDHGFHERIEAAIRRVAPRSAIVRMTSPPVLGAALLGLDRLHRLDLARGEAAEARLRAAAAEYPLGQDSSDPP